MNIHESIIGISILSSSLIDGFFADTIPISFNQTCCPYTVPLENLGIGIESSSKDFILKNIIKLAKNDFEREKFLNQSKLIKQKLFKEVSSRNIISFIKNLE